MAYLDGTEIKLMVDLLGKDVVRIAYRVLNHENEELLERTEYAEVGEGQEYFEIIIPAELNEVDPQNQFEIRLVEIYLQTAVGTIKEEQSYTLESEITLVTGINSFQTYPEALMTALTLTDIEGWNGATKGDRVSAMIAARRTFSRLRFRYNFYAQDHIWDESVHVSDITLLSVDEYNNLPSDFREALKRAQILEVNDMLRDDDYADIEKLARLGVTRSEVYEAKISLGTGKKPVRQALCERAMAELSKWLYIRQRLTRV